MKPKEKRMILIIIVIGVIILGGLMLIRNSKNKQQEGQAAKETYVEVLSDGTKLNKSDKLKETKKVTGMPTIEISNIQLTHQNGSSVLLGDVKNTGSTDIGLTQLEITLLDDKGNVLKTLTALTEVKAGKTQQLNCGISSDYANAYDFRVTKK